jgi:hypothetical protein
MEHLRPNAVDNPERHLRSVLRGIYMDAEGSLGERCDQACRVLAGSPERARPGRSVPVTINLRWRSGAVPFAVQHAKIGAPRTHGRPILVRHDSGDLVQMREVVSCPRRQQL